VKLWGSIRGEISGAARSLRYDLKRDNSRTYDDITYPEYDAYSRRPRRLLATSGITALALGGVAATYFVLSTGLGGLLLNSSTNDVPSNPFPAVTNSDGKLVVAPPAMGSNGAPQPAPSPSPNPTTPGLGGNSGTSNGGGSTVSGNGNTSPGPGRSTPANGATTTPAGPGTPGKPTVPPKTNPTPTTNPPTDTPSDPPSTDPPATEPTTVGAPPGPDPSTSEAGTGTSDPGLGNVGSTFSVSASPTNPIVSTSSAIDA
jgi:hypothetical protein